MAISRCSFDFLEAVSAVQNSERLKAVADRLLFLPCGRSKRMFCKTEAADWCLKYSREKCCNIVG